MESFIEWYVIWVWFLLGKWHSKYRNFLLQCRWYHHLLCSPIKKHALFLYFPEIFWDWISVVWSTRTLFSCLKLNRSPLLGNEMGWRFWGIARSCSSSLRRFRTRMMFLRGMLQALCAPAYVYVCVCETDALRRQRLAVGRDAKGSDRTLCSYTLLSRWGAAHALLCPDTERQVFTVCVPKQHTRARENAWGRRREPWG